MANLERICYGIQNWPENRNPKTVNTKTVHTKTVKPKTVN